MWRTRPTRGWGASIRLPDSPISYHSSLAARRSGSARLPDLLPLVPRSTSIRLCPTPRSPTARPPQHPHQARATETATVPPGTLPGAGGGAGRDLAAAVVRLRAGGGSHRAVPGEHLTGHQLRMRLDGEDDLLIALPRHPDTVRDIQTGGTAGRLDHPDHVTSDALAL